MLFLVGLIALIGFVFIQTLKPSYGGNQTITTLSADVEVYYDSFGVPHIYGANEKDAFKVLGYVHAQDRLWQMELMRRIGAGGLSEVFGKDLLTTDQFFLSLGIDEATKKTVASLDKNSTAIQLTQSYLEGINLFVEEGATPIEFYLTGIEKRPFQLEDVYNVIGYMAFSFAMAHKTDPLLTEIQNELGPEYIQALGVETVEGSTLIKNYNPRTKDTVATNALSSVHTLLKDLPLPMFEGSNSWVLGPQKTKNGQVIFANDPHIGYAQPAVWYEAHINTPNYEMYGYHLAGVPFPLLGHNRTIAYGLTMFENDDIDFYYEEEQAGNPNAYKTPDGYKPYTVIHKKIQVKDSVTVDFSYKTTDHGPVLNGIANQIKGRTPISMSWMYTQHENRLMDAIYGMSHASNIKEFATALPHIHAPGLNVMYGDKEGNIGWWASAQLYQMKDSVNTKLVLQGSDPGDNPIDFLDFSENPQAVNPPWNYVYSANNQPDSISGMLYPGYYLPENRAKRITSLLDPKDDWDKEAVGKMITDVTSAVDPTVTLNLSRILNVKELEDDQIKLLDDLASWDGTYSLDNIAGTVYNRWVYFFLEDIFKDELGEEKFKALLSTHLIKRAIAPLSTNTSCIWMDNINTDQIETLQDIAQSSYVKAYESLVKDFGADKTGWTWNKVHTLEHEHPIGKVDMLRSFFNVGPFEVPGAREVINNLSFGYDGTGFYKVSSGPSTRRVIDFSDVENSVSILPTGQSGNPFSKHYKDQAEMYVHGQFRPMLLNKETIQQEGSLLSFSPN